MDNAEPPGFKSNAMIARSTILRSARGAALLAAIITAACVVASVLRGLRERSSPVSAHMWMVVSGLAALMFTLVFGILFAFNLFSALRAQPELDVLNEETPASELLPQPLFGFVAMEFHWGISNRTFLVMVANEGLYGWKVTGPVSTADREFFETYHEMLGDPEFPRDLPAIRKLAALRGGFIYRRSEIVAVTADDRRQWGMGGIAHSGHVYLRLLSGSTRKFILLGAVIPDQVRDRILASAGGGITSTV